ncbi:hypothetical protein BJY04DRAFT_198754 [Aspergillus karnatakaensis]|uniref:uncharacterized protein n=1 Tax=Aspergillus karnatakaensis TaxID=1810916 RepID=UPI003CCDE5F4
MSLETLPITPAAFAEAIKELTLPVLYAKVAELQNSIVHLRRSNQELHTFVAESCDNETDKQEIEGYISENEDVLKAMGERIQLCKAEVEERGQTWIELDVEPSEATAGEEAEQASAQGQGEGPDSGSTTTANAARMNGSSTSTSTNAPPTERARDPGEIKEDGVYL